jgi:acyl carrier protein
MSLAWRWNLDHQRAREIIAQHLSVPVTAVTDDAEFTSDLGADSLDLVELTMQFEDALNVIIGEEDSEGCRYVEDALRLIDRKSQAA